MAIKIDPPKRIGITGDRTEYLIGYLSELTRQITFELSVCRRQIEEADKQTSTLQRELDKKFSEINAQIAALQEKLEAVDTEEEA